MIAHRPSLIHVDLQSQAFKLNPFPELARVRDAGPLIRARLPIMGRVWLATSYDAVSELLREHRRFVQSAAAAGNRFMSRLMWCLPRSLRPLTTNMIARDEPDHRRLRSLVEQAFQRQSVTALRPRLEVLADQAIDHLIAQAKDASGGVDLVAHFARPFPLTVICELLGLPPEDRPQFTRWASGISTASSLMGVLRGLRGLSHLTEYVAAEIRRQTRQPREGLLAALIQTEEAGDRLTEDEMVAMVFLLLVAGHETTLHQIAGSVWTLLSHPQQLAELRTDWSNVETATQELFRHYSFAQITKPRYAIADTEFRGQTIRRGEMLLACLASANSDPSVFAAPEQLDLHRQPNRHVAFGAGIHFCLGAKLARAETEIALQQLFERLPELRLAVPRVRFSGRPGARALAELPVCW